MNAVTLFGAVPRVRRQTGKRSRTASPLIAALCFLGVAGGVVLAGVGTLRLDLVLMLVGAVLWILGVVAWELATGRFH
jgi:hypothetical protein